VGNGLYERNIYFQPCIARTRKTNRIWELRDLGAWAVLKMAGKGKVAETQRLRGNV
jgi:hypothetical protein